MRKAPPDPVRFYARQRRGRTMAVIVIVLAVSVLVINLSALVGGMWSTWHLVSTVIVGVCLLAALGMLVVSMVAEQTYRAGGGPARRVVEERRPPPG